MGLTPSQVELAFEAIDDPKHPEHGRASQLIKKAGQRAGVTYVPGTASHAR